MSFSFENKKIAVIDDDIVVLTGLKRGLRGVANCELVDFDNASDALEFLGAEQVDAILCDILLPDLDGLNLVRELRRGTPNAETPIVLVTAANADDHAFKEGNEVMKVAYVLKPLAIEPISDALSSPKQEYRRDERR